MTMYTLPTEVKEVCFQSDWYSLWDLWNASSTLLRLNTGERTVPVRPIKDDEDTRRMSGNDNDKG